jgi:hypothetical protein
MSYAHAVSDAVLLAGLVRRVAADGSVWWVSADAAWTGAPVRKLPALAAVRPAPDVAAAWLTAMLPGSAGAGRKPGDKVAAL